MKVEISFINEHAKKVVTILTSYVDVNEYLAVLSALRVKLPMSETTAYNRETTDADRKEFANAFVPTFGKAESKLTLCDSRALWMGTDVKLTKRQLDVVKLLVMNPNEYLGYRTIYDVIQKPGFIAGKDGNGHDTNVRSTVRRIRAKFRVIDPSFAAIETRFQLGYRWRA